MNSHSPAERKCCLCQVLKPIDAFGSVKGKYSAGHSYECKECRREISRRRWIVRNYGITLDEFNEIVRRQGGGCAICNQAENISMHGRKTRLSVDHHHSSGKVRGVLCRKCNAAIGFLNEDAALLEKAASYVRHWNQPAIVQ